MTIHLHVCVLFTFNNKNPMSDSSSHVNVDRNASVEYLTLDGDSNKITAPPAMQWIFPDVYSEKYSTRVFEWWESTPVLLN